MYKTKKQVTVIGGGTGTFVVLKGLIKYPVHLSAIVAMSDSGGSNKKLRDEFGLLPTSDVRQCLVALADDNGGVGLLRKLFMYRFSKGEGIVGMTFGNLFMAALADILGSQAEAIKKTSKVLRIKGDVIPVSYTNTNLFAEYADGQVIAEEHLIDEPAADGTLKIKKIYLKPRAKANPFAIETIENSELIILGPGDLYTSIIPNLLVEGINKAILNSKAKVVYVMNLMTKYGQTYDFTANDHLRIIEKYLPQRINQVIVNNEKINKTALEIYAKNQEFPVSNDLASNSYYQVIAAPLVNKSVYLKAQGDILVRSLIRHSSLKLAKALIKSI